MTGGAEPSVEYGRDLTEGFMADDDTSELVPCVTVKLDFDVVLRASVTLRLDDVARGNKHEENARHGLEKAIGIVRGIRKACSCMIAADLTPTTKFGKLILNC